MELLVTLAGMVVDLVGRLNLFAWLAGTKNRRAFVSNWKDSNGVVKLGFVLGVLLYLMLALAVFFGWQRAGKASATVSAIVRCLSNGFSDIDIAFKEFVDEGGQVNTLGLGLSG